METLFPCWYEGIKSYTKGGRVQCDVCGSFAGVKSKNYFRKDETGKTLLKLFTACVNCGSKEIINNRTGEILAQIKKEKKNENKLLSA